MITAFILSFSLFTYRSRNHNFFDISFGLIDLISFFATRCPHSPIVSAIVENLCLLNIEMCV
jgi:hypothetical protein